MVVFKLKSVCIFKENNPKHKDDFYFINYLHALGPKIKLKSHENVLKSYDYCHVKMSEKHNKILRYNQDRTSKKIPSVIYVDKYSLLEKIQTCDNSPQELF